MISYYSSGFEKLFLKKISEPGTHEFVICTGYARHSYIERFDDSSVDPGSNFSNKIRRLLIGDPLGHPIEERKKIDGKLGKKVLFCDKLRFNKKARRFNPIVHSKIFIGYDANGEPIWAMVGSNNFTNNAMLDRNRESMLYIEDKTLLSETNSHFNNISKLCDRLGSLNIDRIVGNRMDGGYTIRLKSQSGQAIDEIFIIEVLVEDEKELALIKKAGSVLLDCIESSELLNETSNGLYRPFIVIFVDNVKLEKCDNIIVKYGYTRASVATNRGADYSGKPDGHIRYYGDTIADFDEVRVHDPNNNHTHDIPFSPRAYPSDFLATTGAGKKKKMAQIINRFLKVNDSEKLNDAYSSVSVKKATVKRVIPASSLNSIDDNEMVSLQGIAELIPEHQFDSLESKMGYLGDSSLSGKDAHGNEEFSLKSRDIEDVSRGMKEIKKQYPGEYFAIVKSALDIDDESQ